MLHIEVRCVQCTNTFSIHRNTGVLYSRTRNLRKLKMIMVASSAIITVRTCNSFETKSPTREEENLWWSQKCSQEEIHPRVNLQQHAHFDISSLYHKLRLWRAELLPKHCKALWDHQRLVGNLWHMSARDVAPGVPRIGRARVYDLLLPFVNWICKNKRWCTASVKPKQHTSAGMQIAFATGEKNGRSSGDLYGEGSKCVGRMWSFVPPSHRTTPTPVWFQSWVGREIWIKKPPYCKPALTKPAQELKRTSPPRTIVTASPKKKYCIISTINLTIKSAGRGTNVHLLKSFLVEIFGHFF